MVSSEEIASLRERIVSLETHILGGSDGLVGACGGLWEGVG